MYGVRRASPKLTVRALYIILKVAVSTEPLPYNALRVREDESYDAIASLIAILSDGRGKQSGMNVIARVSGTDRRSKCVKSTAKAEAYAVYFASILKLSKRHPRLVNDAEFAHRIEATIQDRVLPALRAVLDVDPGMNVTTLSTFLFICTRNHDFGTSNLPASQIARELNVTNLSRNMSQLGSGSSRDHGLNLIKLDPHPEDGRALVPYPTEKGGKLLAEIIAGIEAKADVDYQMSEKNLKVDKDENPVVSTKREGGA